MRPWFAAALLAIAGGGEAQSRIVDDRTFCATLRQLLTAANERPAFASLGQSGPARAAGGLGFEHCRVEAGLYGSRLNCTRFINPRYAPGPAPEARIAHCLPEALRMSEPDGSRLSRFRLGTLALHVAYEQLIIRFSLFALPVERR